MKTKLTEADRDAVASIVNTSIDDAKNSIAHLPTSERSLHILTAALECETADLSPRKSLVALIRAAIKRQAKAAKPAKPAKPAKKPRAPKAPKNPVFQVSGDLLTPHPALARVMLVPTVAEKLFSNAHGDKDRIERGDDVAADWAAWVDELKANGIIEPLRVIKRTDGEGYWIAEGRNRHTGGAEAGIKSYPVIEVKEEDLPKLAVGTVTGRRHWTKSQRAFFAVLMNPEVAGEDRKGGDRKSNRTECGLKNDDLASRFGVSLRLIEDAIKLYRLLDKYPDFRDRIEPSLWGGASLAGLLQGMIAMADGTSGPNVPVERFQPMDIKKAWVSERAHAANWGKLTDDQKIILARIAEIETAELPADYLAWKLDIIQRAVTAAVPADLSTD